MTNSIEAVVTIRGRRTAHVRLAGELAYENVNETRLRLLAIVDAGCDRLVIDAGGLAFCDSTGLGMLLALYRDLQPLGGALELRGLRGQPARLVDVTGVAALLTGGAARVHPAEAGQEITSA